MGKVRFAMPSLLRSSSLGGYVPGTGTPMDSRIHAAIDATAPDTVRVDLTRIAA